MAKGEETVLCGASSLQAWYNTDYLPFGSHGQETLATIRKSCRERDSEPHLWSVCMTLFSTFIIDIKSTTSLDPVQVTQMAKVFISFICWINPANQPKYLETVYVSGWQSSSTASSTNEPGPDLAGKSVDALSAKSNSSRHKIILQTPFQTR